MVGCECGAGAVRVRCGFIVCVVGVVAVVIVGIFGLLWCGCGRVRQGAVLARGPCSGCFTFIIVDEVRCDAVGCGRVHYGCGKVRLACCGHALGVRQACGRRTMFFLLVSHFSQISHGIA